MPQPRNFGLVHPIMAIPVLFFVILKRQSLRGVVANARSHWVAWRHLTRVRLESFMFADEEEPKLALEKNCH